FGADALCAKATDHGAGGGGFENNYAIGKLFFTGLGMKNVAIHIPGPDAGGEEEGLRGGRARRAHAHGGGRSAEDGVGGHSAVAQPRARAAPAAESGHGRGARERDRAG